MNPLIPQTFTRRGKRALAVLFVFRLAPLAAAIVALVLLAMFKDPLFATFGSQNPEFARALAKTLSLIVGVTAVSVALIAFILAGLALIEYYSFAYMFDSHSFKTRRGIFHIIELAIPYQQIQNVDLNRPLAYRFFGVSRIVILTAGRDDDLSDGRDSNSAIINLIPKIQGEAIQHELLDRSHDHAS